ncbi:type I restriction enzyme S subunit [Wenyingzhuangia heitensis]|uniref:Type I restriction enzyme S subunit n=1 Tax=Wenyingzhuangia heitensis TaxID=1487859 RepID=A0ABX0U8Q9_9FLAO|nr:restriction endonuclease subunit S [Wenyingzhuangia heitensis]NIJ45143.1 type I restriction enzyme S subunit [Wenyingzhuangia heitensis]
MKDNWKKVPLGELVTIQKGKISEQSTYPIQGFAPIINTDVLRGNVKVWGKIKGSVNCLEDDVLILWDGERSGLCAIGHKGVLGSTFAKMNVSSELVPEYLFRVVDFNYDWIQGQRTGTGVPHVPKDLKTIFKVNYPPLPQQQKIAKILSTVDAVIEQTESAIAKYQAIKQGLMHDLFTRGIDVSTGKLRPTPQEAPDLYKESALGLIPRDWEDSVFKNHLIKNLYGPRFSGDDYDSEGNVKTIRGMDFSKDGEILYSQAPIALLPKSKVYSHLLETGDVVMVTTADCGLTAVFEEQDFQFIPSAYSVKFRFNEEIEPYFIKFFMQTDKAKRLVNKYVRQGTLGNLPGSDVLGFNISLPKIDEQKIIIEKLKAVESKIQTEQQALAKYQQLKSGLLQDLLTGKVEVGV